MSRLTEYQKAQKWLEGFDWDNDSDASEHLATICEALQEIDKIKDKQEQGLLFELKVPLGTTIWYLAYQEDFYRGWWEVKKSTYSLNWIHFNEHKKFHLTESEAEEALARMKGE